MAQWGKMREEQEDMVLDRGPVWPLLGVEGAGAEGAEPARFDCSMMHWAGENAGCRMSVYIGVKWAVPQRNKRKNFSLIWRCRHLGKGGSSL